MSFTGGALFIAFSIPIVFFLMVWFVVTIARIYLPDKRLPFDRDTGLRRDGVRRIQAKDVVGSHQIRARQRALADGNHIECVSYQPGLPETIPESWKEELLDRRN